VAPHRDAARADRPCPVQFSRTIHLDSARVRFGRQYPQVGFDAFSVRLDAAGRSVGYSADLGCAGELRKLCARPLDVLVTELAHFHPERLVDALRGRNVKHLVVTHMARQAREQLPAVRVCLRRLRSIRVRFAADGDVIKI